MAYDTTKVSGDDILSDDYNDLVNAAQHELAGLALFKMGTFTRDMEQASGNVSISGLGFAPKLVLFTGAINGVAGSTYVGMSNGTNHYCTYDNNAASAGTTAISTTKNLRLAPTAGGYQVANIDSLDVDGFTLAWTKAGLPPAGTATIFYIAFK